MLERSETTAPQHSSDHPIEQMSAHLEAKPVIVDRDARTRPLILIADDDEIQRLLLREALEEAGLDVAEADDGARAIAEARRVCPDIILLDVVMPDMDGFDVCRAIRWRQDGHDVPIIMVTGADDVDSISRAYDAGATDFMAKPVDRTILGHRLRYICRASRAFDDLKSSQANLAEAQQIARLGSWEWCPETDVFRCSEVAGELFGMAPKTLETTATDLLRHIVPDDRERVTRTMETAVHAQQGFAIDFRIVLPSGSERAITTKAKFIGSAPTLRFKGTSQDITERKQAEARIHHLAFHDVLTNLPNRKLFQDRLQQALAIAQRDGTMVAVLCLDLDHFKDVNDTLGHAVGDRLLQAVGQRLKVEVRGSDTVSRLGGDEFAIVQVGICKPDDAELLATRLVGSLTEALHIDGHEVCCSASVGVSVFPTDGVEAEQLLMNADIALYKAKAEGRSTYRFYEAGMDESLRARKALEQDLRAGLRENWFELHYQPQVATESERIVGAEALVRLRHPERGLLQPGEFIPLAEDTGMIVPIGEWVLETACQQAKVWHAAGLDLRVSVNVSAVQFRQSDIVAAVDVALSKAALPPELLELEVTESVLMHDIDDALSILKGLRTIGVRIAMDDFGTGYSSLTYLKLFPFDRIKIDRSFLRDIVDDPEAVTIVRAIISLGRNLNMMTTAEGVETVAQVDYLKGQACDDIQGFFYGRAMLPDQFEELLESHHACPVS